MFSDEELRRFRNEYDALPVERIEALLARLDAAEKVCKYMSARESKDNQDVDWWDFEPILTRWRKASGKDS